MESAEINARSVLAIVSRRRWALLLPFLFFLMLAGWLSVVLPRLYRGEATILYQPRALPKEYVQQLGSYSPEDWLRALTQRITARERLLAVAREVGLYPNRGEAERAELMRQATSVELVEAELRKESPYRAARETPGMSAFKLSFEAADPVAAAKATNLLAGLLVKENHLARLKQAAVAGNFINQELEAARGRLEAQEGRLTDFKQRYAGQLPEQVNVNITSLATAQLRLQQLSQQRAEAHQKVLTHRQRITEMVHGVTALSGEGAMLSEVNPLLAELQAKRQELEVLRGRYTGRHPDVVRVEGELGRLEKKLTGGTKITEANAVDIARKNPLLKDLSAQLEAAETEYGRLSNEENQTRQDLVMLQQRLDIAPQRAQELEQISRDFVAVQSAYQALLGKRLETRMAANLENREVGDQFAILDSAAVPLAPVKPSFKKVFVFCTLLGLVFGMIGATVMEFADDSFRSESDAEGFLKLPVLASVPRIQTAIELRQIRRQRSRLALIAAALAAGYVMSLALLHLNGVHLRLPV